MTARRKERREKLFDLVIVDWVDSYGGDGWQPLSEITAPSLNEGCQSVGWLAATSRDRITIVPHRSGKVLGRGDITIPRASVKRIQRIVGLKNSGIRRIPARRTKRQGGK